MLRQASVHQLRAGSINRASGYIAICMCFYPRNLPKASRDEYLPRLAPDRGLFREWKEEEKRVGHEAAFTKVRYEERFSITKEGFDQLARLSALSREKDVFLVCQCSTGERCHREILLITAREEFGARVGNIYHSYPRFAQRLPALTMAWRELEK